MAQAFHRLAVPLALIVATTSTAGIAFADSSARPFVGNFTTAEVIGFDPAQCAAPPFLAGTTKGSGIATHMGSSTISALDCLVPGASSFTFSGGKFTITAANRDTVTADYSGSLIPTSSATVYTISGSYRITGGTGRFAGATGAGSLGGSIDIKTGHAEYNATGTLGY